MYDYLAGSQRIDKILNNNGSFEELNYIPTSSKLTHSNGFYVSCSAIFIDIRKSSNLTDTHRRPTLAKLYRAFISEVISVLQSSNDCKHIDIQGDCVGGIFNTPYKKNINDLFFIGAEIISLINILNYKFRKKNMVNISAGIGMSHGKALMIKAGLKGSGENDIVWIGDVVNHASKLSDGENTIHLSESIYQNLNTHNQELSYQYWSSLLCQYCYSARIVDPQMNDWLNGQKSSRPNLFQGLLSLNNLSKSE